MLRSGQLGIYTSNYKRIVSGILGCCFTCLKQSQNTVYSDMRTYHRVSIQQPFEKLSVDLIGPYTVRASNLSRARVKLHCLLAVCLSTGLLTQVLMDGANFGTIVHSLWLIQMRYNVQITHLQSGAGTAFNNLGAVAEVGK